jgi:hypothetical protein
MKELNGLKGDGFEIIPVAGLKEVMLRWVGRVNVANPPKLLDPYLHTLLWKTKGRSILIDFTHLYSANPSTFYSVLRFFRNSSAMKIEVRVQYDFNSEWQTAMFRSLEIVTERLPGITILRID